MRLNRWKKFNAAGKAVIVNDRGKILVLRRAADETHLENKWDVPGGRYEYGEDPVEGLEREVEEEAGILVDVGEPVKAWTFTRDDGEQVFGTTFFCSPLETDVELGEEHTVYKWVEIDDLETLEMHQGLKDGLRCAYDLWEEKSELPKLVRDRIPDIIRSNGDEVGINVLSDEEIETFVRKKVVEEAEELWEAGNREELADLCEVVERLIALKGWDWDRIEKIRSEKREKRGGFEENLVLDEIEG